MKSDHSHSNIRTAAGQLRAAYRKTPFKSVVQCKDCCRFMTKDSFSRHAKKSTNCCEQTYVFALHPTSKNPFCYKCGKEETTHAKMAYHYMHAHDRADDDLARIGICLRSLWFMIDKAQALRLYDRDRKRRQRRNAKEQVRADRYQLGMSHRFESLHKELISVKS